MDAAVNLSSWMKSNICLDIKLKLFIHGLEITAPQSSTVTIVNVGAKSRRLAVVKL